MWCVSVGLFLRTIHFSSAFLDTKPSFVIPATSRMPSISRPTVSTTTTSSAASLLTLRQSFSSDGEITSSADVDSDEDAEQRLGDEFATDNVNCIDDGEFSVVDVNSSDRWHGLLASTGLEGKLTHVTDLPVERKVSTFDIFCNRELKLGNLAAIGFDMDYTLAQYQQPAFDKLAFDGAKEKLVSKLG